VGNPLARVFERRQRAVHVLAANQIEDQARLLGRRAHIARRRVGFNHRSLPAPAGFAAPAPPLPPDAPAAGAGAPRPPRAAAAAAAARSATLVVWPLKILVGANSPSLWPTMFSVMYTGMNFFPLCTARVCPTISGITVDRRDHVLMTFLSAPARFMP